MRAGGGIRTDAELQIRDYRTLQSAGVGVGVMTLPGRLVRPYPERDEAERDAKRVVPGKR